MRESNCGVVSSNPLVLALGSTPATSNNPTAKLLRLSIRHVKLTRPTSSIRKSDSNRRAPPIRNLDTGHVRNANRLLRHDLSPFLRNNASLSMQLPVRVVRREDRGEARREDVRDRALAGRVLGGAVKDSPPDLPARDAHRA